MLKYALIPLWWLAVLLILAVSIARAEYVFVDATTGAESAYTASGDDSSFVTGTLATANAVVAPNADLDLVEYGLVWAVTAATCTGDGNGGTLTVNASNQIVCAADDGGASHDAVTLAGTYDYLSLSGQEITLLQVDLAADVTGTLAAGNGGTGATSLGAVDAADLGSGTGTDGYVLTADGAGNAAWEVAPGAGGGMTSWTLAGDTGGGQAITDGNTASIVGDASGIDTVDSATDTLTISFDPTEAEAGLEAVLDLQDLQGAVTDAQVPDNITVDLATTATTATAGDSATAFFPSGTIEHERGGLEADVSAYAGIPAISGGATYQLDTLAELNTALGGIALIDTGTLTNANLCVYDLAGLEIDCNVSNTLHAAVTLAGEDYLTLSTQQITANAIDPDNLAATDFGEFSCNGTTCELDYALTWTRERTISDPADADDYLWFKAEAALTLTAINCVAQGTTPSITVDLQECDSNGANCATSLSSVITCNGGNDAGTLSDTAVDSGDWMRLNLGAPSGTVDAISVQVNGTKAL